MLHHSAYLSALISSRLDALRYLHSFPTRRSSDLPISRSDRPSTSRRRTSSSRGVTGLTPASRGCAAPGSVAAMSRSEEHTSELQSPCNLVCRLLLEKKNTNNKYQ